MKSVYAGFMLFLCAITTGVAQTNRYAFFRITSPTNTVITGFNPDAGTISIANPVIGVANQVQRTYQLTGGSGWVDFVQLVSTSSITAEIIIDLTPPSGMVFIPGGNFKMGDGVDGFSIAQPVRSIYVSGFYLDKYEVTKSLWDMVYAWAIGQGYSFDNVGFGKAANHPVHSVNWYDMVKWCNARSELEGRVPCYTFSGSTYRSGQRSPDCDWALNGYRLPTEAEWEKAARGGLNTQRFDWGNLIAHSNANYYASSSYVYDVSPTFTYHPDHDVGGFPYSSPVGSFAPNEYGACDLTGNMWELCWDWYDREYYGSAPASNPRGPGTGLFRVARGGSWSSLAWLCRSPGRGWIGPTNIGDEVGFRVCLSAE